MYKKKKTCILRMYVYFYVYIWKNIKEIKMSQI